MSLLLLFTSPAVSSLGVLRAISDYRRASWACDLWLRFINLSLIDCLVNLIKPSATHYLISTIHLSCKMTSILNQSHSLCQLL